MQRKLPTLPDDTKERLERPESSINSRTYRFKTITPLFGGGVKAGFSDVDCLVRASSIRGQLRFWWRATKGAGCESLEVLKARENKIWGSPDRGSPILIKVMNISPSRTKDRENVKNSAFGYSIHDPEGYALFPLRSQSEVNKIHMPGIQFDLSVTWKDGELEVELMAALKAWANFGGIGGRTRRGLGAVECDDLRLNENQLRELIPDLHGGQRDWSVLESIMVSRNQTADLARAWKETVRPMKEFRQNVGIGRHPSTNNKPAGPSKWPEANTVRDLTRAGISNHGPVGHPALPVGAPRGELGLPIVFEFYSDNGFNPQTPKCQLIPTNGRERYASPFCLRPIRLAGENGYRPIAAILNNTCPPELKFEKLPGRGNNGNSPIPHAFARQSSQYVSYRDSPLYDRSKNNGSAYEGFKKYLSDEDFKSL